MTHTRVVLVLEASAALEPTLELARRWCPSLTHLHVVWLADHPERASALARVHETFEPATLDESIGASLASSQLNHVAERLGATLVVFGPWPGHAAPARAWAMLQLVARADVDVLLVGAGCRITDGGHVTLALEEDSRDFAATAEVVRALPGVNALSVALRASPDEATEQLLRSLFHQPLEVLVGNPGAPDELIAEAHARQAALVVVATSGVSTAQLMLGLARSRALLESELPMLVLHHEALPASDERLTATACVHVPGQPMKVLLERTGTLGRVPLRPDEAFVVVAREDLGTFRHVDGVVTLPSHFEPLKPFALAGVGAEHTVAGVELLERRPLVLLDAEFPLDALSEVEPFARDHTIVVVRLRAAQSLANLQARFADAVPWGGRPPVIDATSLLDDGGAFDVSDAVDGVRLLRLGLRLLCDGWPVVALVSSRDEVPASAWLTTWTAASLRSRSPSAPLSRPPVTVSDAEQRWHVLTGARLESGHHVELELDNVAARQRVLSAIANARERVHWQSYMVDDDPIAAEVVEAMRAAAARGVTVRVLVDALYSLHDAFGRKNPLLEHLASAAGVEVRAVRPVSGLPRVADLKRRNHRKLFCVDGRVATITGRNLGAPYYRGFGELRLTPTTDYHDVPWIDAGIALRGPLVERVDRSFLTDWVDAGGASFPLRPAGSEGAMACRMVVHDGLDDAHSLDALVELVRSARRRVVVLNTFPPILELQRAFIAAVRRGVQVQFLIGNVLPRWGDDQSFGNGALRSLGDDLVRGRLEPVLRAGAQGFECVVADPDLGPVFTHVHAKLFVRDDDLVAVGSANLDATSGYWESELLVLVQDAGFAARTLGEIDELLARARPIELSRWKSLEARRAWLSKHWPAFMP